MGAATIKIFLADETLHGIRIIEKSNWTGRGFDFARADWSRARSREDFARPGVYVLINEDIFRRILDEPEFRVVVVIHPADDALDEGVVKDEPEVLERVGAGLLRQVLWTTTFSGCSAAHAPIFRLPARVRALRYSGG